MFELPRPDILIFDMDGTLVDVRQSYRAAAPLAATRYLELLGLAPPELTGAVYDQFKLMGGFNDDWDLTAGLLEVIVAALPTAPPLPAAAVASQDALLAALRAAVLSFRDGRLPLPDFAGLISLVRAMGGGLAGLRQVTGEHNRHLVWRTHDAATTDLVQRIFEELYLGADLFASAYGYLPRFHRGAGLIETEQLLISPAVLDDLARHVRLGIATGRADFELVHPMRRWELGRYFSVATTMTDAMRAQAPGGPSLLKPHPYLLERAADALDPTGTLAAAYIGDAPDDVMAARRAGGRRWLAVAVVPDPALDAHFTELGAHAIIRGPDELTAWIPCS
jgi:HAD superfamily hydrolase (TIGR01548 family)